MNRIISVKEAGEWADKVWPECVKQAYAEQPAQQETCEMGSICIGCSPKNSDGSCPGQQPNGACDCYVNGFNDGMKELEPPAQRTWVGLTNEECVEIAARGYPRWLEFAHAVEAKLRSKNT